MGIDIGLDKGIFHLEIHGPIFAPFGNGQSVGGPVAYAVDVAVALGKQVVDDEGYTVGDDAVVFLLLRLGEQLFGVMDTVFVHL